MQTKVCKCCGKELPLDMFSTTKIGVLNTCKECVRQNQIKGHLDKKQAKMTADDVEKAKQMRLENFTPRDLMLQLKKWGYEGKLTYTVTKTVDISTL